MATTTPAAPIAQPLAAPSRSRALAMPRPHAIDLAAVLAPLAAGLFTKLATRSTIATAIAAGTTAAVAGLARWQLARLAVDEVEYTVEQRIGALEIRRYAPFVEARIEVKSDLERALHVGFHRLDEYVRGANWGVEKLVRVAPTARGVRLPRRHPVLVGGAAGAHTVAFVVQPGSARTTLPEPYDDRIALVAIPERRMAVLRFHGPHGAANVQAHLARLLEQVELFGFKRKASALFAHYDAPSTLPLLRRNEIWIEVA